MNLFELREEKEDTEADIRYYKNEIERLETRVGVGSTDYSKESSKTTAICSQENALLELTQMSLYLDDAINKLKNITSLISEKYNIYRKHNDYDKQIYTEKKLFKWSNAKISAKHGGMSRWTIKRIVERIENEKTKK